VKAFLCLTCGDVCAVVYHDWVWCACGMSHAALWDEPGAGMEVDLTGDAFPWPADESWRPSVRVPPATSFHAWSEAESVYIGMHADVLSPEEIWRVEYTVWRSGGFPTEGLLPPVPNPAVHVTDADFLVYVLRYARIRMTRHEFRDAARFLAPLVRLAIQRLEEHLPRRDALAWLRGLATLHQLPEQQGDRRLVGGGCSDERPSLKAVAPVSDERDKRGCDVNATERSRGG
jgi:hypothetical protein